MAGFTCPYCDQVMSAAPGSLKLYRLGFNEALALNTSCGSLDVRIYKCPACEKYSVVVQGSHGFIDNAFVGAYPNKNCKSYPDYIPKAIRDDYEEASKIVHLSPKAAATLARRCLQGMIRDFYGIHERSLYEEITSLRGRIPDTQWKAIDALRKIGNIGAHMERDVDLIVDVESEEAAKLVKLIELLVEKWYVARHDEELLLNEIIGIADVKSQVRSNHSQ